MPRHESPALGTFGLKAGYSPLMRRCRAAGGAHALPSHGTEAPPPGGGVPPRALAAAHALAVPAASSSSLSASHGRFSVVSINRPDYFSTIASLGHASTQTPHPVQRAPSTRATSPMVIAPTAHSPSQIPHPVHAFASTTAFILPVPRSIRSPAPDGTGLYTGLSRNAVLSPAPIRWSRTMLRRPRNNPG